MKTVQKCYEKLGISVPKPISLSWVKNVEVAGCVVTAEKLFDGSSLLSTKLFDFLNSKMDDSNVYSKGLRPAVDTCYGDLSSNRLRRLGSNHEDALNTKDGGASSSPVASFILGKKGWKTLNILKFFYTLFIECIYAELMNFEVPDTKENKPDYCSTLKDHVKKCGLW